MSRLQCLITSIFFFKTVVFFSQYTINWEIYYCKEFSIMKTEEKKNSAHMLPDIQMEMSSINILNILVRTELSSSGLKSGTF